MAGSVPRFPRMGSADVELSVCCIQLHCLILSIWRRRRKFTPAHMLPSLSVAVHCWRFCSRRWRLFFLSRNLSRIKRETSRTTLSNTATTTQQPTTLSRADHSGFVNPPLRFAIRDAYRRPDDPKRYSESPRRRNHARRNGYCVQKEEKEELKEDQGFQGGKNFIACVGH